MYWIIRGTDARTEKDFALVVEARSHAAAESWALKRNVPYVMIDEATDGDVRDARVNKRLWKHTRDSRYCSFGQPVPSGQLACLMVSGVATILLLLRAGNVQIFS
jgi:hypothetical protein